MCVCVIAATVGNTSPRSSHHINTLIWHIYKPFLHSNTVTLLHLRAHRNFRLLKLSLPLGQTLCLTNSHRSVRCKPSFWNYEMSLSPQPTLCGSVLQCKLEFQSCLSGKAITLKCNGMCPCLPGREFSHAAPRHKSEKAGEYSNTLSF